MHFVHAPYLCSCTSIDANENEKRTAAQLLSLVLEFQVSAQHQAPATITFGYRHAYTQLHETN